MRKITLVLAATAAASLATAALAQPQQLTPEQRAAAFKAADKNGDGKLDKAEFTEMLPEQAKSFADRLFERRDANKDGFISAEENAAPMQRQGG